MNNMNTYLLMHFHFLLSEDLYKALDTEGQAPVWREHFFYGL